MSKAQAISLGVGPLVEERLGRVDVVLVHAGISRLEPSGTSADAAHEGVLDAHTKGAFLAAWRLAPLVRDVGSIVFTAVTGEPFPPGRRVPSDPEAALAAIAQIRGAELAPRGIRVEAARSSFLEASVPREAWLPVGGRARSPMWGNEPPRMQRGDPAEEIARAVLGLALDAPLPADFERTGDTLLASFGVPPEPMCGARSWRSPR